MNLDSIDALAKAASDPDGDWFCEDLLENHEPIVSTIPAKRFMHACSPAAVLAMVAVCRAAKALCERPGNEYDMDDLRSAIAALDSVEGQTNG